MLCGFAAILRLDGVGLEQLVPSRVGGSALFEVAWWVSLQCS